MLWGYFDESGTDGQLGHTFIAGFIGTPEQWAAFVPKWDAARDGDGVDVFHYCAAVQKEDCYEGWDYQTQIRPHLDNMATVLTAQPLQAVAVRHVGNFDAVMNENPDWKIRFPSPYSLLFEMLVNLLEQAMPLGERVALFMARHPEFTRRTREVYDHYKFAGLWPHIQAYIDVGIEVSAAQAADMFAYESRRFSWKTDEDYWRHQPFLSRWLPLYSADQRDIHAVGFDDDGLRLFLNQEKGQYLKTPPSLLERAR